MAKPTVHVAGGLREDGVVIGNAYDKYGSTNPIVRRLMAGFHAALDTFVARAQPRTIHEVGCGEGYWVLEWRARGLDARGSDFSTQVIDIARRNAASHTTAQHSADPDVFTAKSIYAMQAPADSADLIVCCEVLEHVEDPDAALAALARIATGWVIVSVPREPIWRALNLVRGKYVRELGNTPGHIQHWSRREFRALVGRHFDVVDERTPLPWTMLLCRVKQGR